MASEAIQVGQLSADGLLVTHSDKMAAILQTVWIFFKWNIVYLDWNFTEVCSWEFNSQEPRIGSSIGLTPNRSQVITRSIGGSFTHLSFISEWLPDHSKHEVEKAYFHPLYSVTKHPVLLSYYTHFKMWDEITYPFPNFNGCISNFNPRSTILWLLILVGIKVSPR